MLWGNRIQEMVVSVARQGDLKFPGQLSDRLYTPPWGDAAPGVVS
jgi:hypothetical protein